MKTLIRLTPVGGDVFLAEDLSMPVDPGFGGGRPGGVDPGYGRPTFPHPGQGLPGYGHPDQGLPGHGHPDNGLPIAPVRPSPPIVLPPITTWPPQLPPNVDNSLPPEYNRPDLPIVIPPDPSIGIELPIVLPPGSLSYGLLIVLTPTAMPKEAPPNTKPAILVQPLKKPVLVYVQVAPMPK